MTFCPNMKSHRLFGATVVLLKAIESQEGMNSLISIYFDGPRADAAAPTRPCTLMELVEAMTMLVRLGFVPVQQSIGAASRNGGHHGHPKNQARPKSQTESNAGRTRVQTQAIRMKSAANGATMN